MSYATVLIQDLHAPERVTSVHAASAAAVVGGWLSADGLRGASPSVRQLARAIDVGDWPAVHVIAEDLSVAVTVIEDHESAAAADEMAADIWSADWLAARDDDDQTDEPTGLSPALVDALEQAADMADGWGFLGALGS